jgi:hypothetical protein
MTTPPDSVIIIQDNPIGNKLDVIRTLIKEIFNVIGFESSLAAIRTIDNPGENHGLLLVCF